jgi:hypothetical protein
MARERRSLVLTLIAGVLFILAGVRDFLLPGFMSMSPVTHTNGTAEIAVGAVFVLLGVIRWKRSYRGASARG